MWKHCPFHGYCSLLGLPEREKMRAVFHPCILRKCSSDMCGSQQCDCESVCMCVCLFVYGCVCVSMYGCVCQCMCQFECVPVCSLSMYVCISLCVWRVSLCVCVCVSAGATVHQFVCVCVKWRAQQCRRIYLHYCLRGRVEEALSHWGFTDLRWPPLSLPDIAVLDFLMNVFAMEGWLGETVDWVIVVMVC